MNPISISGYHIREAGATAVQELAFTFANTVEYVRRAVAAGLDVTVRAAAVVLLRLPQRPVRGGREVPRRAPDVGAPDARAVRRQRRSVPAAVPHPDRRCDAHRAAAAEQRRARHHAGARRGARWHAVAAHQRVRRGAGAAHRRERDAGAAHTADRRVRKRRARPWRPVGRQLLRRGADRRAGERGARVDRRGRGAWRGGPAIERGFFQEEIARSAYDGSGGSKPETTWSWV